MAARTWYHCGSGNQNSPAMIQARLNTKLNHDAVASLLFRRPVYRFSQPWVQAPHDRCKLRLPCVYLGVHEANVIKVVGGHPVLRGTPKYARVSKGVAVSRLSVSTAAKAPDDWGPRDPIRQPIDCASADTGGTTPGRCRSRRIDEMADDVVQVLHRDVETTSTARARATTDPGRLEGQPRCLPSCAPDEAVLRPGLQLPTAREARPMRAATPAKP
jgi:hypothetical protein